MKKTSEVKNYYYPGAYTTDVSSKGLTFRPSYLTGLPENLLPRHDNGSMSMHGSKIS